MLPWRVAPTLTNSIGPLRNGKINDIGLDKNVTAYSEAGDVVKLDTLARPELGIDQREVGFGQLHERVHR